jgi:hypothetical protein
LPATSRWLGVFCSRCEKKEGQVAVASLEAKVS